MKDILNQFVIHPDVQFGESAGEELVAYRLGSRASPKHLESGLTALFREFTQPTTIPEAVRRVASRDGDSPENVLRVAWPAITQLLRAGFLVRPEAVEDAPRSLGTLPRGYLVGDYTAVQPIRVLLDSQVYLGVSRSGKRVSIKCVPFQKVGPAADRLRHEHVVLMNLADSGVVPALLAFGLDPFPYLVCEWFDGLTIQQWLPTATTRQAIHVAIQILRTYETLHAHGVAHGDVNPGNILVSGRTAVLVDFDSAFLAGRVASGPRRTVLPYQEPEAATALLGGSPTPRASAEGDQYCIASLLFYIITRFHHISIAENDRRTLMTRLANGEVRSFESVALGGLAAIDAVLQRALAKDPVERYPNIASFRDAFSRAAAASLQVVDRGTGSVAVDLSVHSVWFTAGLPSTPTASINFSAAGVALCLLERSTATADASLLELADVWSRRHGRVQVPTQSAVIRRAIEEDTSILHASPGTSFVRALVANARGDNAALRRSILRFTKLTMRPRTTPEFALGTAGLLAGAAALTERTRDPCALAAGQRLSRELWAELNTLPPIGEQPNTGLNLGFAHGWAGVLWSTARWCEASADEIPPNLFVRAEELRRIGRLDGRALRWPWRRAGRVTESIGWCNGSSGFVLAYLALSRLLGAPWLEVATAAGAPLVGTRWRTNHLCCGAAGGFFASARLYGMTGDRCWLDAAVNARDAALRLAGNDEFPFSLFRGSLVNLLVDVDTTLVANVRLPGFE